MGQPVFLKIYRLGQLVKNQQFLLDQISIGSGEGPSLVLSDSSIASWHVLIEKTKDGYKLSDLGSPTGTFLNSKPVLESSIQHGDQIKIGDFTIHFHIGVPFAKQEPSQESQESQESVIHPLKPVPLPSQEGSEEDPPTYPKPLEKMEVLPSSVQELRPKEKEIPDPPIDLHEQMQSFVRESSSKDATSLPKKTKTYAPSSRWKNLDSHLSFSGGSVVEVIVAWKERILSVHHFQKSGSVKFGSDPQADISLPNLLGEHSYHLLDIKEQVVVYASQEVKAHLIQEGKSYSHEELVKQNIMSEESERQTFVLGQYQILRLDFGSSIRLYIRYVNESKKAILAAIFDFSFSEMIGIALSFVFMSLLMLYIGIFSSQFLDPEEDLDQLKVAKAVILFKEEKKPRLVKINLSERVRKRVKKQSLFVKKAPKKKYVGIKKRKKSGQIGSVKSRPKKEQKKKKIKKTSIVSARPGQSVTTKKSGASPKSSRPDPTKVGLLAVFGTKGTQKDLDKAYSGSGELAGLAESATGYAGQKESYTGEGIGTRFKNAGRGEGTSLIGVSEGIRTKGRGGGGGKDYQTGGSLGQRGKVDLNWGDESEIDIEGGVDRDAIRRVITRNRSQLEACYDFALQKNPNLSGKILIQWDILNEGVRNVVIKSNTTGDSVMSSCFKARFRSFRFTGSGLRRNQVGTITIPFVLSTRN